jgi:hypothetical protein
MPRHDLTVEFMRENEIPAFVDLTNSAFASAFNRLLRGAPPGRPVGERVRSRFYRPETDILVLRDLEGRLCAALPLQRCGSRAVPGPLAIAPHWQEPWQSEIAPTLVEALLRRAVEVECAAIDSVTFPHSAAHFALYWRYGMPVFQVLLMMRPLRPVADAEGPHGLVRFSALSSHERGRALASMRDLTEHCYPGYHLSAEIVHVHARGLGETYLWPSADEPLGFAICHHGERSEAYSDDQFFVKYLHVEGHPGASSGAIQDFLPRLETTAAEAGLRSIALMASSARRSSVDALVRRGYRIASIDSQWLMMPKVPGIPLAKEAAEVFRPDQVIFADWR